MRQKYLAAVVLLATVACSSGDKPATQNGSGHSAADAKPEKNDEYRTLMAKNLINYQHMTVGFVNFDMGKIQTAAENLVATSQYLAGNIPQAYQSSSGDWKAWCDELEQHSKDILQKAQSKNHAVLRASFENVMKTCMGCHMLYRKHLLTGSANTEPRQDS